MKPVEPTNVQDGGILVILARDQPEYDPLPAAISADGVILTEWEFSAEELSRVLEGGRVRLWIHSFGLPINPVSLEVTEP